MMEKKGRQKKDLPPEPTLLGSVGLFLAYIRFSLICLKDVLSTGLFLMSVTLMS